MRNIIVVDIDDTLHSFGDVAARVAQEEHGVEIDRDTSEWGTFMQPLEKEHWETCFHRAHDRDMIFDSPPYVGSVEGVQALHEAGFEIHYYSDRKLHAYDDTREWLEVHGFPTPENLECTVDKRGEIAKFADRLVTIIDDRPRTIVWARYELGLPYVFSLKHNYNRNLSDIPGVVLRDDWASLSDELASLLPALDKTGTSS